MTLRKHKRTLAILLSIVLFAILALGCAEQGTSADTPQSIPSPTPESSPEPTPLPTPEITPEPTPEPTPEIFGAELEGYWIHQDGEVGGYQCELGVHPLRGVSMQFTFNGDSTGRVYTSQSKKFEWDIVRAGNMRVTSEELNNSWNDVRYTIDGDILTLFNDLNNQTSTYTRITGSEFERAVGIYQLIGHDNRSVTWEYNGGYKITFFGSINMLRFSYWNNRMSVIEATSREMGKVIGNWHIDDDGFLCITQDFVNREHEFTFSVIEDTLMLTDSDGKTREYIMKIW